MKHLMFSLSLIMLTCISCQAQDIKEVAKIEAVVRQFSVAGDRQDAGQLNQLLHQQFRAVVNRLFGAPELSLMDKALYLQLMKDKKIGGDTREVVILQTDIESNIATVKAVFQGKALRFTTFISLVKLESGEWQIVGDMPDISKA
jgi:Putative lumazine-binding